MKWYSCWFRRSRLMVRSVKRFGKILRFTRCYTPPYRIPMWDDNFVRYAISSHLFTTVRLEKVRWNYRIDLEEWLQNSRIHCRSNIPKCCCVSLSLFSQMLYFARKLYSQCGGKISTVLCSCALVSQLKSDHCMYEFRFPTAHAKMSRYNIERVRRWRIL